MRGNRGNPGFRMDGRYQDYAEPVYGEGEVDSGVAVSFEEIMYREQSTRPFFRGVL
jgi:hypothetical protein